MKVILTEFDCSSIVSMWLKINISVEPFLF